MESLHVNLAISMSEFKTNPAAVLRQAGGQPVAVLNHNRVSFYMLEPTLFSGMLQELARAGVGQSAGAATASLRAVMDAVLRQAQTAATPIQDNTDA